MSLKVKNKSELNCPQHYFSFGAVHLVQHRSLQNSTVNNFYRVCLWHRKDKEMKDLISLHDLTSDEVKGLLELGLKLKKEQKSGIEHHILQNSTVNSFLSA